MKHLNKFENFANENLDSWKEMMNKEDLKLFSEYQRLSKSDLEQMREDWKALRRFALSKLNQELNASGKEGQLLSMDVSDDELYSYLDDKNARKFFKYSRILDFADGYRPEGFVLIKKGL